MKNESYKVGMHLFSAEVQGDNFSQSMHTKTLNYCSIYFLKAWDDTTCLIHIHVLALPTHILY